MKSLIDSKFPKDTKFNVNWRWYSKFKVHYCDWSIYSMSEELSWLYVMFIYMAKWGCACSHISMLTRHGGGSVSSWYNVMMVHAATASSQHTTAHSVSVMQSMCSYHSFISRWMENGRCHDFMLPKYCLVVKINNTGEGRFCFRCCTAHSNTGRHGPLGDWTRHVEEILW